jgi:hypothetical protein
LILLAIDFKEVSFDTIKCLINKNF